MIARAIAIAALVVAAIVAVATWRQIAIGARAMGESDAALGKGDVATAIARARDAAEAAAPGSPYPTKAYERLASLARDAEGRGDERTAVAAWSAMRAAATATEGPFSTAGGRSAMAEEGIARSGSRAEAQNAEIHASADAIRAELAQSEIPSALLLFLLAAGAASFFAGGARLALAARDVASLKRERVALAATAAGLAIYVIASLRT